MTSKPAREAFVWIWLPGETDPVVAGRLEADNGKILFNYGKSYLDRVRHGRPAISIYAPELPLKAGALPLPDGLAMPGCIRDAAPDAWGRRVIINYVAKFSSSAETPELSARVSDTITATTVVLSADRNVAGGQPIRYTITLGNPVVPGDRLNIELTNGLTIEIPEGQTTGAGQAPTETNSEYAPPEILKIYISRIDGNTRLEKLFITQGAADSAIETTVADPSESARDYMDSILAAARMADADGDDAEGEGDDAETDEGETLTVDGAGRSAGDGGFGLGNGAADGGVDGEFIGGDAQIWSEAVYI